jgi:5'-nucleotidase
VPFITQNYHASHRNNPRFNYNKRMKILISNDDGYFAPGLNILAEHLAKIADITVVAPERNRSGASNSLTLDRPLSVKKASNGFFYVNGTPTDCVHIALTGLMDTMPDMVISGINDGANMGDDTIYSGTVAAAMEGFLLDIPSFAVSMSQHNSTHFETAARVAVELVQHYQKVGFASPTLLNINVPDIAYDQLKGRVITRLGKRHKAEPVIQLKTPRNETVYWVGAAGKPNDGGEGTDFYAISQNMVSISPIQVDLTKHAQMAEMQDWLKK